MVLDNAAITADVSVTFSWVWRTPPPFPCPLRLTRRGARRADRTATFKDF